MQANIQISILTRIMTEVSPWSQRTIKKGFRKRAFELSLKDTQTLSRQIKSPSLTEPLACVRHEHISNPTLDNPTGSYYPHYPHFPDEETDT